MLGVMRILAHVLGGRRSSRRRLWSIGYIQRTDLFLTFMIAIEKILIRRKTFRASGRQAATARNPPRRPGGGDGARETAGQSHFMCITSHWAILLLTHLSPAGFLGAQSAWAKVNATLL